MANGILVTAGVGVAVVVLRQPALRRLFVRAAPRLLRELRPVHVAAAIAALSGPALAAESVAPATAPAPGPVRPGPDSRTTTEGQPPAAGSRA